MVENDFEQSVNIFTIPKRYSVLVQTDKSIYKPGDTVNFRVMTINSELQPQIVKEMKIELVDPYDNVVDKFDPFENSETSDEDASSTGPADDDSFENSSDEANLSDDNKKPIKSYDQRALLEYGMVSHNFKLANDIFLDSWKIRVSTSDKEKDDKNNYIINTTHNFEVQQYVLPRFEVFLETKHDVSLNELFVNLLISAKYTFDEFVTGSAKIVARTFDSLYPGVEKYSIEKSVNISSEELVSFDIQNDLRIVNSIRPYLILFNVEVKEFLTGQTMSKNTTVRIYRTGEYVVEIVSGTEKFKPGIPYKLKVLVKKYDGSFVRNLIEPVKLNVKLFYKLRRCQKPNTNTFSSYQYDEHKMIKNGTVYYEIAVPENTTAIAIEASFLEFKDLLNVARQESKSREYLEIKARLSK